VGQARWKEFQFQAYDDFHALWSRWQSSSKAFGPDKHMLFEGGSQHVTTNVSIADVRRLVRGDFRLPEPMMLHEDDDVLAEVLAEHGVRK
jgi:hypothetical protein